MHDNNWCYISGNMHSSMCYNYFSITVATLLNFQKDQIMLKISIKSIIPAANSYVI